MSNIFACNCSYEKNVIVRSNREYDYFGNVLEYEYDYFPSYEYSKSTRTRVRVQGHEYDYSISEFNCHLQASEGATANGSLRRSHSELAGDKRN